MHRALREARSAAGAAVVVELVAVADAQLDDRVLGARAQAAVALETVAAREATARLVDRFYAKIRTDPQLGPIFERVVRGKWDTHLEKMRDFWSSVMLTTGRYKGAPVPAHLRIKDIEPRLFDRWLQLFGETCDELFDGEVAEAFRAKAARIAESLKLALFFRLAPASSAKGQR